MTSRQGTISNRRKLVRIATRIPAQVSKVSGWWLRGSQGECEITDYNRFGAGLLSARALSVGSRLLLDLNAEHFVLRRLPAEVVSCVRDGRSYRVGVRFYRNLNELVSGQASAALTVLHGLEESLAPDPLAG
jgi:hypothetical protein